MLTKSQINSLVKHLRDMATILEASGSKQEPATTVKEKSKRGRKPGAVADNVRCQAQLNGGERCKNRATMGDVCGKHLNE